MVVRLALAPWTARLTLAIGVLFPSSVGSWTPRLDAEHAADAPPVAGGHGDLAAEAALAGRGLLLEHVVQPGLPADQLAGLGHLEAPGGAPVALHLGHGVSWGSGQVRAAAGGAALVPPPWVLRG